MESKYIIAIVAVGLFAVLFLIFFMMLAYRRNMEAKLQMYLHEAYSEKNLIKFNYDAVDENAPPIIEGRVSAIAELAVARHAEQEEQQLQIDEVYGKMEKDGIEEITGNYKP